MRTSWRPSFTTACRDLDPADYNAWLDPENQDTDELQRLLKPDSPKQMSAKPVSTFVNNVKNQGPECVEPLGE